MSSRRVKKSTSSTAEGLHLFDQSNNDVDLTSAITVQTYARRRGGGWNSGWVGAKVTDASGGKIEMQDSIVTSGTYEVEVRVQWNDGTDDILPDGGFLELDLKRSLEDM